MELQSEPKLEAPTRRIDGKTFGKSKDSLKTKSATERFKSKEKKNMVDCGQHFHVWNSGLSHVH